MGVDKTRKMEHSGTSRNMKKKNDNNNKSNFPEKKIINNNNKLIFVKINLRKITKNRKIKK